LAGFASPERLLPGCQADYFYKDVRGAAFQQAFSAAFLPGDCAFIVRPLLRGAY